MKRIRVLPALIFAILVGLLAFGLSRLLFNQFGHSDSSSAPSLFSAPKDTSKEDIQTFLSQIKTQNFGTLYENTKNVYPTLDSKESYETALANLFEDINVENVEIELIEKGETVSKYQLHEGDTYLGTISLERNENDAPSFTLPIQGSESYIFEVPTGATLSMNGMNIDSSYMIEQDVPATNFSQLYDQSNVPHVDIYEVGNLLGQPDVEVDGKACGIVEDAINKHLLVGEVLEDEDLKEFMISAAQKIAQYPAQEVGLGAVSEVVINDSSWYQRYVTLQNYWFTAHSISNFSNQEVLNVVKQSDDTAVGEVVFDYYADNGEVHRTWHIGYQMTMVKTANGWKVGCMEINNELNPNQIMPE